MTQASRHTTTLSARIRNAVRVDERRLELAAAWLLDSIHQHTDYVTVGIISGVIAGHSEVVATLLGATGCMLALLAIYMVQHHVHTSTNKRNRAHVMTDNEQAFDDSLRTMVHSNRGE